MVTTSENSRVADEANVGLGQTFELQQHLEHLYECALKEHDLIWG